MKSLSLNKIYEWPVMTRSLIIGLVCAIVFYLGYSWDLSDMKSKLLSEQQKEQDIFSQLDLIISQQQASQDAISHLSKLQGTLNEWKTKLIKYSALPDLLNQILKIGSDNRLHISLFNPEDEIKMGSYTKVPIKAIVVGSYHQIATFISQVANMPNIVEIDDFTLSSDNKPDVIGAKLAGQANAENLITAKLSLGVYVLGETNNHA